MVATNEVTIHFKEDLISASHPMDLWTHRDRLMKI